MVKNSHLSSICFENIFTFTETASFGSFSNRGSCQRFGVLPEMDNNLEGTLEVLKTNCSKNSRMTAYVQSVFVLPERQNDYRKSYGD